MENTHKKCLLCNSTELADLKNYEKDYLVKCNGCDFVFSHKIPSPEELQAHYNQYNRGCSISHITIKRYNELLDVFEKYRKTGNMLDIGCGDGHFLTTAMLRGWTVYGTEFTDEAIAICKAKGVNSHKGTLNADNYKGMEFDVITSFEVIEHINVPQAEIQNIKKILRNGGLLYMTTPNFNSVSRYVLGPKWTVIEYPEHLSYYTPKTMHAFLRNNGFGKIKIETTGINISRFKNSITPAQGLNANEKFREKSESKAIYKYLKLIVNGILNVSQKGDNLKTYYIKKG